MLAGPVPAERGGIAPEFLPSDGAVLFLLGGHMSDEFYQPSPAEIAAECARIQAAWSASERHSRTQKTPPKISDCDFVGIQAAAEVSLESTLFNRRDALAG